MRKYLLSGALVLGLGQLALSQNSQEREPTIPLNSGSQDSEVPQSYYPEEDPPWFAADDIRIEMELDNDQIERLNDVFRTTNQKWHAATEKDKPSSLEAAKAQNLRVYEGPLEDDFTRGSASIFRSPQQRKRFNELNFQYKSYGAFENPQIQRDLNLNDQQKQQLLDLNREWNSEVEALRKVYEANPALARSRFQEYRERSQLRLGGILNDVQNQAYKDLVGKPHQFDPSAYLRTRKKTPPGGIDGGRPPLIQDPRTTEQR